MSRFIPLADLDAATAELHNLRRTLGMTLKFVEEKTGISASKLSRFERRKVDLNAAELASLFRLLKQVEAEAGVMVNERNERDDVT